MHLLAFIGALSLSQWLTLIQLGEAAIRLDVALIQTLHAPRIVMQVNSEGTRTRHHGSTPQQLEDRRGRRHCDPARRP
jgi:hypothetical protein